MSDEQPMDEPAKVWMNCNKVTHDASDWRGPGTPCYERAEFIDVSSPFGSDHDGSNVPWRKTYCAEHAKKYDKMVEAIGDVIRRTGPPGRDPEADWRPLTQELVDEYHSAIHAAIDKKNKKARRRSE